MVFKDPVLDHEKTSGDHERRNKEKDQALDTKRDVGARRDTGTLAAEPA